MKISRKELYDLIWEEPLSTVCKRFDLSFNELRKYCISLNIPTPPKGYWSKLKFGKTVEKTPLPDLPEQTEEAGSRMTQEINRKEMTVELEAAPVNKQKEREMEILSGEASYFIVPEVLYAKSAVIIDTKERFRNKSHNSYLEKNPYTCKIKETLDIYVSDKMLERALRIFDTVIKGLQCRGHHIKMTEGVTYAVVKEEEIGMSLKERRQQVRPEGASLGPRYPTDFCGELQFILSYGDSYKMTYKDTTYTRLEDKVVSIIACLELKANAIKEERIARAQREKEQEEKDRKKKEFTEKRENEVKEFQTLFIMAERFYKANIIREYIDAYAEYLADSGIVDKEITDKLEWAKEKADWLDPFISKEDEYLDGYNKEELIHSQGGRDMPVYRTGYSREPDRYKFWLKPAWRRYK